MVQNIGKSGEKDKEHSKDGLANQKLWYIVGKGENAGYQHFLLFSQCFPKLSSLGSLKVGIVWWLI